MEITAIAPQTVSAGQNILFTETAVASPNCSIIHRSGSGLVSVRGLTRQCRSRYKIYFAGNIGVPSGSSSEITSVAITVNDEPIGATIMFAPEMSSGDVSNVSNMTFVDVPKGCCVNIAIENVSDVEINVQNANLIVERVA